MFKLIKDSKNRIPLIVFVITMFVAISPLISRYCINGHDLEYHLLRIESLKEGILIGKPFMKVNTLFFGGAGYASSMFYSDLLVYIPAILRALGVSIGASYHIFAAVIFALTYGSTYYCTYKMTDSKVCGTIAAVLLTLCPYHMDDILVRAACGEYMAFVFIPFVIYGLYNILYENMDKPWIFGIGFAGLILSHPATLVMCTVFSAIVLVINIKKIISNKTVVIRVVITTAIVLCISAYQWIPMLEQMMSDRFYVSLSQMDMLDAAVPFYSIFTEAFPAIGIMLPVIAVARMLISREDSKLVGYVDILIAGAVITAIGASNIMPWERVQRFLNFIQFPWRLFTLSSVLFAFADAIIIVILIEKITHYSEDVAIYLVLVVSAVLSIAHFSTNAPGYYDYANDYYSYKPYTANVIGGEWLPEKVADREAVIALSEHMYAEDGSEVEFVRDKAVITASINAGQGYVDVPFIYYKGYKADLVGENGESRSLKVDGNGINGMCRVYLDDASGVLKVYYGGTMLIKISAIISVVTLIILLGLWLMNRKKNHSKMGTVASVVVVIGLLPFMTGCSTQDIQHAADTISDLNEALTSSDFSNPSAAVDYLKKQNNTDAIEEESVEPEEINYIEYNLCQRGYDTQGQQYAIKVNTEPEVTEYTIVSLQEAKEDGAPVFIKSNLYGNIADSYIKSLEELYKDKNPKGDINELESEELCQAIMYEADMLLFLEYYPEQKGADKVRELANKLAEMIYDTAGVGEGDLRIDYNSAAILAKASYLLTDVENADDLLELAGKLWEKAEGTNTDDELIDSNRAWAAAELFRATENKTYRTIVEAIASDTKLEGMSYENPGYYAVFAYLSSGSNTDYAVSGKMMSDFFADANSMIKESKEELVKNSLNNIKRNQIEYDFINDIIDDCKLAIMANYISISVEYTKFVEERVLFLCGANPIGTDYLSDDYNYKYNSILYAVSGLRK